jgi:outer membrane protein assembly factor BamA
MNRLPISDPLLPGETRAAPNPWRWGLALVLAIFPLSFVFAATASDSLLTVSTVVVQGNETTKEYVILREMRLKPGTVLTPEAVLEDQNRIYNLQLFNKVDVDYSVEGRTASVYVTVVERWYIFPFPVFGFRYRDPEKIYYGAGLAHQNFGGRNEKLYLSFALGYDRWLSLVYQNPKLTDSGDVFFRFQAVTQLLHNLSVSSTEYEQTVNSFGLSLGTRFGMYEHLVGSLGYQIWRMSDPQAGRTVSSSGRDAFFQAGLQYWYDDRDNLEYTTEGTYLSAFGTKSGLGESDVNLLAYGFDARQFMHVVDDVSFGARSFGTFQSGGFVPQYQHVFFGYNERIRGYFYDVEEGESLFGLTVEVRIPIFKARYLRTSLVSIPQFQTLRYGLSFNAFADGGKIWYRTDDFSAVPWKFGYGAGLQFLLPYGMNVETDIALNDFGRTQFVLDFGLSL